MKIWKTNVWLILTLMLLMVFSQSDDDDQCTQPIQRKEIRQLNPDELTRFINAVKKLSQPEREKDELRYYSAVHYNYNNVSHNVPPFLPWHRHFIRLYEMDLQMIDPTIVLPYWDWTLDAQAPEASIVFSDEYFGGDGDKDNDYCVMSQHFKGWQVNIPEPHCLRRDFSGDGTIPAFYSPEAVEIILRSSASFQEFHEAIESGPHILVHNGIGGDVGDMSRMISPNDPLFFMHHAFVDLLWSEWQLRNPHLATDYGGKSNNTEWIAPEVFTLDDELEPFEVKVRDQMSTLDALLCYEYPRWSVELPEILERIIATKDTSMMRGWSKAIPLAVNDLMEPQSSRKKRDVEMQQFRANMMSYHQIDAEDRVSPHNKVRTPQRLPTKVVVANHLNQDNVNNLHDVMAQLIAVLNSVPGFVPATNTIPLSLKTNN